MSIHNAGGQAINRGVLFCVLEQTRSQVEEYQRCRNLFKEMVEISKSLSNLQLKVNQAEKGDPEENHTTDVATRYTAVIVRGIESLTGSGSAVDLEAVEIAVRRSVLPLAGHFVE